MGDEIDTETERYDVLRYPSTAEPHVAVEAGRGVVLVDERLGEAQQLLKRRAFGVAVVSTVPIAYTVIAEAPILLGVAVAVVQFVGLMFVGSGRYDFVPELVAKDVPRKRAVEEYGAVIEPEGLDEDDRRNAELTSESPA